MKRVLFVTTMLLALGAPPGRADVVRTADQTARDAAQPLDISWVSHGHTADGRLKHTIATRGTWPDRRLQCPAKVGKCRGIFDLFFSNDRDRDFERRMSIYFNEGRFHAQMSKYWYGDGDTCISCGGSKIIGDGKVRRSNRRSISVVFPRGWIRHRDLRGYDWWASVYFQRRNEGKACTYNAAWDRYRCHDSIPGGSSVISHEL